MKSLRAIPSSAVMGVTYAFTRQIEVSFCNKEGSCLNRMLHA
jgi:hypothetical protein